MFPTLFRFGDVTVHTYFAMASLGFLVAIGLGSRRALDEGYSLETLLDILLIVVFGSFLGARIVYVLTEWGRFVDRPLEALELWKGGLVWYGGPMLVIPLCIVYGRLKGQPLGAGLDIAAAAIPLGHAFGRIGCLGYGCCYGSVSDLGWAVPFPRHAPDGLPRHPTQAYEALGLLVLWFLVDRLYRRLAPGGFRGPRRGAAMAVYLAGYGALRFVVEIFRGDDRGPMVILSVSQWISLGAIAAGLAGLAWIYRDPGTGAGAGAGAGAASSSSASGA